MRWREPADDGEGTRRDALLRAVEELRDGDGLLPPEFQDLRGAPLQGADLSRLQMPRVDLSGADLSNADLSETVLLGAKLDGTVLYKATLHGTEFAAADLSFANLRGAKCQRAGFGTAKIVEASFLEANLEQASLAKAEVRGSDFRAASLRDTRLRGAQLRDCDFTRADLHLADLDFADVAGSTFDECDLREVRPLGIKGYETASWIGTDLRDVNFSGAYLFRRFASDQNYIQEFRSRSRWTAFAYTVWWVTSDCGRSLTRWAACTLLIAGLFAVAYLFVEIDYGDSETVLSPLYYSVVTLTSLGYGDVLPRSVAAQALAMCEVMFGYVMLGGILAIFSNKLARRAD
ncbi:MAG: hypothetical protein CMJ83_19710 [Planctomycetes bacterium]|nr:hypothetical protein [Planctomycetota bacterium]